MCFESVSGVLLMFRSRGAATTPKAFLCCLSVVFSYCLTTDIEY